MFIKVIMAILRRYYRNVGNLKVDILSSVTGYIGDKKLGIDTSYYNDNISQNIHGDSVRYEPTTYADIQKIIEYLKLDKDDIFVELGCGKGRVICSIATQRLRKIIGIELDEKMVKIAKKNISNLKLVNTPVELVHIDANNFNPIEGTIFFLFNPFGENTLNTVLNNLKNSLEINPRKIRIIYHNSMKESLLEKLDWLEFEGVIENSWVDIRTSVWRNKLYQYNMQSQ